MSRIYLTQVHGHYKQIVYKHLIDLEFEATLWPSFLVNIWNYLTIVAQHMLVENLMSTVQEYKKKLWYEVLIRYLETTLKSQLAGTKLAVS